MKNVFLKVLLAVLGCTVIIVPTTIVLLNNSNNNDGGNSSSNGEYTPSTEVVLPEVMYTDSTGANAPELLENMVPIKYNGKNWVYADASKEWYDYASGEWANAVILNSKVSKKVGDTIKESEVALWYVWIPRYKYTIFNGEENSGGTKVMEIDVTFESGTNTTGTVSCTDAISTSGAGTSSEICTDTTNGKVTNNVSTYTHPAFTFGDDELTGFWMGKFELSGKINSVKIVPNAKTLTNYSMIEFFTAIQNLSTNYKISNGDSHMIKNMEWGAVAYLKQSQYGLGTTKTVQNNYHDNKNEDLHTGWANDSKSYLENIDQTTTGNVYGVYDMNGGGMEFAMGNMSTIDGKFNPSESGFTNLDEKYYDKYSYNADLDEYHNGKLGDATKETISDKEDLVPKTDDTRAWYDVYANFPTVEEETWVTSWFTRGGHGVLASHLSGIFYYGTSRGEATHDYSTRGIITPIK